MNPITGGFILTKLGAGTLQLNETGNNIGQLDLDLGILAIGANNVLSSTTDLNLANATTFNLNGFNQQIQSLTGTLTSTVTNDTVAGARPRSSTLLAVAACS